MPCRAGCSSDRDDEHEFSLFHPVVSLPCLPSSFVRKTPRRTMSNQCSRLRYHDLGLLSTTDGSPRSTSGPRVRACALSPRRHATPMSHSAITPDVHQALDVHCHFTAQIALDSHFFVDNFANAVDLVVRQVPHAGVRVHVSAIEELLTGMESDAKDIGQSRLNTLVARKIDPCNSRHVT